MPARGSRPAMTRSRLRRLLDALESPPLLDLVDAYGLELAADRRRSACVEALCAHAKVDVIEVVQQLLVTNALRTACRRLNLVAAGGRADLVERLLRALDGSYRPFVQARELARGLGLRSGSEWRRFCRGELPERGLLPPDVPRQPWWVYRDDGWLGWGDFLGTGRVQTQRRAYRSFEDARELARSLGLGSVAEWRAFARGDLPELGALPPDVPASPRTVYRDAWRGWTDFLGTEGRRRGRTGSWSFERARRFARRLRLTSAAEWKRWVAGELPDRPARPQGLPASPQASYRAAGWSGWEDFLGPTRASRQARRTSRWRAFEDARAFARTLGCESRDEWLRRTSATPSPLPPDVPRWPANVYAGRWRGWADFLGAAGPRRSSPWSTWRAFDEAREFVRALGLRTTAEWSRYCRGELADTLGTKPDDIPQTVERVYAGQGWCGWGDFLGHGRLSSVERHARWRAFVSARRFARGLGLSSQREWALFCRGDLPEKGALPADIPANPHQGYRRMGWTSWGDFLGTRRVADQLRTFLGFEAARAYARSLGLGSQREWAEHCKRARADGELPDDISTVPHATYRGKGWAGWGDWLGTGNVRPLDRSSRFRSFRSARAFARRLGLKTQADWERYVRGELPALGPFPDDLPVAPGQTYAKAGWSGWPDFLASGYEPRPRQDWLPFAEARRFARALKLGSVAEWKRYVRGEVEGTPPRPVRLSRRPDHHYRGKGWRGWLDFLGVRARRARGS